MYLEQIKKLKNINTETLKLISLYKKAGLMLPFGLKGNIGEFYVVTKLMQRFPKSKIDFIGGANPHIDIIIDGKRIQVKTSFGHKIEQKRGSVELEICPTVKKRTIESKLCDYIVLIVVTLKDDYSTSINTNAYIFNSDDFRYFNKSLCWSGKSKGDLTIANIINIKGTLSKKLSKDIAVYNTSEYRELFENSSRNWDKINNK